MAKQPVVIFFGVPPTTEVPKKFEEFTPIFVEKSTDYKKLLVEKKPDLLVTVGEKWDLFPELAQLSTYWKVRWIHKSNLDEIDNWMHIYQTWYNATLISDENPPNPLFSVFSTSYKSKDRILRPLRSLMAQSYKNWEWVIFDDTPEEEDPANWKHLRSIANSDPRIRIYKSHRNSGLIGEVKHNAASLCRGQLIAEFDHDDDLHVDCLQWIVNAARSHPEIGFFSTLWCEVYEEDLRNHQYAEFAGLGFTQVCAVKHQIFNTTQPRWVWCHQNPGFTSISWRHIVGVANHIRVWRTKTYHELGGFNTAIGVADDYEFLLRTFLRTKMMIIPRLGYIQYRNAGGSNFTFLRNAEIQKQSKYIAKFYEPQFNQYFETRKIPNLKTLPVEGVPFWEQDAEWQAEDQGFILPPVKNSITVIMIAKGSCKAVEKVLQKCLEQTHTKWELFITAGKCDALSAEMDRLLPLCDDRVRWWNLPRERPDFILINYVLRGMIRTEYVTYVENLNKWNKDHLAEMVELLQKSPVLDSQEYELAHSFSLCSTAGFRRNKEEEFRKRLLSAAIKS